MSARALTFDELDLVRGGAASALLSEIDLGILSREEAAMKPTPADRFQRADEDWLYFALGLAAGCRLRMRRMNADTPDFYAEQAARQAALTTAMVHYNELRRRGHHISADLAALMKREGI